MLVNGLNQNENTSLKKLLAKVEYNILNETAKKIKLFINHDRIYPPSITDGIIKLLDAAEPTFKAIKV